MTYPVISYVVLRTILSWIEITPSIFTRNMRSMSRNEAVFSQFDLWYSPMIFHMMGILSWVLNKSRDIESCAILNSSRYIIHFWLTVILQKLKQNLFITTITSWTERRPACDNQHREACSIHLHVWASGGECFAMPTKPHQFDDVRTRLVALHIPARGASE